MHTVATTYMLQRKSLFHNRIAGKRLAPMALICPGQGFTGSGPIGWTLHEIDYEAVYGFLYYVAHSILNA